MATALAQQAGKATMVENRAGGAGSIGYAAVAKSPPDGSTLSAIETSYTMLPALMTQLPWKPSERLIPVALVMSTPVALIVRQDSPFQSLQEFLARARKEPGRLTYGSGGVGSSSHLSAEVLASDAGLQVTHIPYKGAADAMVALMGGQVDFIITAVPTALSGLKGGKIRGPAVTGDARLASVDTVPTFKEGSLAQYKVTNWSGLGAPAGTPQAVVARLQGQVASARCRTARSVIAY